MDEREIIERFYDRFAAHDGRGMEACYATSATFSDPVFTSLRGVEVGGMWRMLTQKSNLQLTLDSLVQKGEHRWEARWTAKYTFSATGRNVTNVVTSDIRLEDGKIVEQHDTFDFRSWQTQALGWPGAWLGWTGIPGRAIQKKAMQSLRTFLEKA
jgi:ketosteroid isomerase-like protein